MGVYNGARYLPEQLDSIIAMMSPQDELIISYDVSTDNTWDIINEYAQRYPHILVVRNPGEAGVTSNFNNALKYASGRYFVPSDQDDVWINNKLERMICFMEETGASVAWHNSYMCDASLNILPKTLYDLRGKSLGVLRNFIKPTFMGCCMIFRAEYMPLVQHVKIMPDSTDHWYGLVCMKYGKVALLDEILLKHRLHENNVTPTKRRKLSKIIRGRYILFQNLMEIRRFIKVTGWKRPVVGDNQ